MQRPFKLTTPMILLAFFTVSMVNACSKSDDPTPSPDDMKGTMDMPALDMNPGPEKEMSRDMDAGSQPLDQDLDRDTASPDLPDMPSTMDLGVDMPDTGDMMRACTYPPDTIHVNAETGDDTANGLVDAPFATITRAMQELAPGIRVVVHDGIYQEAIIPTTSGTEDAPILIGPACGAQPILDGSQLSAPDGLPALIKIIDQSHLRVHGFTLRNLTATRRSDFPSGIWVRGASHHISITSNKVHDITAWQGGDQSGAHGIAVYGTSTSPSHDIVLAGNHVHDLVLGWSEAVVINGNVRDFKVLANTVEDVNNIAFDFIGFEEDVCPTCNQSDLTGVNNVNRARQGVVEQNIARRVSSAGNPAYGQDKSAGCYYVDGGADILFEQNLATECDIGVELASEAPGKSTRQIIVRNNLLYDLDVTGIATGGYDPGNGPGGGAARECTIIHNTIVNASVNGWANAALVLQNRNIDNRYQNNIVIATEGTSAMADYGEQNSGNIFSHNLYQGALDGVEAGEGSLSHPAAFQDADADDYSLSSTSPAVDAALELPESIRGFFDFAEVRRPQGNAADIGAFERESL